MPAGLFGIDTEQATSLLENQFKNVSGRHGRFDADRIAKRFKEDVVSKARDKLIRVLANDIFPLPDVVNPARRESGERDLTLFLSTYFPAKFYLSWSTGHTELIHDLQQLILEHGGTKATAMPRGSGKTSIVEGAAIWALFYGHKRFVLLLGAKGELGKSLYHSIKTEIEYNPLLLEDFPEICHPFFAVENNPFKFKVQTHDGEPTRVTSTSNSMSLPEIAGSKAAGSYILCTGITSGLRGLKRTVASGENLRPDLVIVDDPQTDKSAKSRAATEQRERIIQGAIMGLAGPGNPLTVIMPCTVIQKDDLADRFLDRQRKPEWRGQRTKLLDRFPDNMELWSQYQEIKNESYRAGRMGEEAREFYSCNRAAMDKGAVATWLERYDPPFQLSAVQYAMDLYFRDPVAFASEYQNEPLTQSNNDNRPTIELKSGDIVKRLSGIPLGIVPRDTICITGGIDIQKDIVYWLFTAWTENFGGVICAYGSCPDQALQYFDSHNIQNTLSDVWPGLLQSPLAYKALEHIRDTVCKVEFMRDESTDAIPVECVVVDANWNLVTDAVYSFCKANSQVFHPAHGRGIGAAMLPMDQWSKKTGEVVNKANWRTRVATLGANRGRHIMYDTNFWKSRIGERLIAPMGTINALKLYGDSLLRHQLLADHLSSELPIRTHGRGRDVDEWRTRASTTENHWWDCLVMAGVAASKCGMQLLEVTTDEQTGNADVPLLVKAVALPERQRKVAPPPPPRRV